MTNTKLYGALRPTKVAWLPEIPSHWETARGRHIFRIQKRIAGKLGFDVLSVTQGGIKLKDTTSGEGQLSQDYSKYQLVFAGDFVMNHMDLLTGWVDQSSFDGVTSPDYRVFELIDDECDPEFFRLVCQVGYIEKLFYAYGQGVSHLGRWRFPADNFKNFVFPKPPLPEQQAAAKAVGRETARIDALIEKKTRFIELLKEKRQALITQAVTKGLDPNVEMKDSRVEWIGETPAHWRHPPSYAHFKAKKGSDAATLTKEYCLLNPGPFAVYSGQTENQGVIGRIDRYEFDLHEPAILTTTVGAKAMSVGWTEQQFSLSQNCMLLLPGQECHSRYYLYFFECLFSAFRALIPDHMQPSFRMEDFYGMRILLPPLAEQISVAEHLDMKLGHVERLVNVTMRSINLLKERRSALITAAVTGQIDLREDAA